MKIYKYPLSITEPTTITLPSLSKVLTAQLQGDELVVWVEQGEYAGEYEVIFRVYITGDNGAFQHGEYVSTFQQNGFVGHVYYTVKRERLTSQSQYLAVSEAKPNA